ncbi:putative RdRP [Lampyris noctiluca errantivirus 1]|nr:putative RdRP [Lampyris noctiluca errantivirus 1]
MDHLNDIEIKELKKIIKSYEDLFLNNNEKLTHTNVIKHQIKTTDDNPIYTKSYRYPEIYKAEVKQQIDKMLENEIIQESYSPWSSPIWIVPKKMDASGKKKFRMVVDYRKLNQKTIDDKFPIPNITEILDKLGKSIYFTTLDLESGFHQIEVDKKDIQKTAFSTETGHYEFLRMPFGLKNAPSTFQRLMNYVLREYIGKICLVYLDDIIILGTSLQEHSENIRKVFQKLRENNLKIQIDKSEFFRKEVAYLGHIVSREGVKPNPDKIEAIKNYTLPKTTKEIKGFLGLLGYYRRFIPNFSKITKPFTTCLKKNNKIDITNEEYLQCFKTCKNLLTNSPILQYPDFTKEFILTTDASNYALGAVLSQNINGKDLPIAYASRTLNEHEINYSTIEKELLAIIWGTKYFRPYLYGVKFIIRTDHKPLTWLFSLKDPNSKLLRWKIKLDEYNYEIQYKKGITNTNADALSRIKPKFRIKEISGNLLDSCNNIAHCISADKKLSKGIALQLDKKFLCRNYLNNLDKLNPGDIIPQIQNNRLIFHLVTKENYFEKPSINYIKICLLKLKDYCEENEITKLDVPRLCSGLDKINFKLIKYLLEEIFCDTNLELTIYNFEEKEIFISETSSIIAISGSDVDTIHSAEENEMNGVTYIEGNVNIGRNQCIISQHNGPTDIKIINLFQNKKKRIIVKLNYKNINDEIIKFLKEFITPNIKYYCYFDDDLHLNFNNIIQKTFAKKTVQLIKCSAIVEDVELKDEQIEKVINYHEGKTNHRGINETYQKLRNRYYWPNMIKTISDYINKCEICLKNKYERDPIKISDNLTPTPNTPFEIINLDTLTLEKNKFLTIIDQFSKFGQIYHLINCNSIEITKLLIKYFATFTVPKQIIFDQGTEFNNQLIKELLKFHKIKLHITCVDNPKSNSPVERFHSTIIEHLRILKDRPEFQKETLLNKINYALIAYNHSIHSSTRKTPQEILFGNSETPTMFQTSNNTNQDVIESHKQKLKTTLDLIKTYMIKEKEKRHKPRTNPDKFPQEAFLKEHPRRSNKISKPIYKKINVKNYNKKLGVIKDQYDKKHRIDKLKRPRLVSGGQNAPMEKISET